jgi:hypothetical protein
MAPIEQIYDSEPYAQWRERIEREGVPDPPVIFAGNWARKAIEDLQAEVERLRAERDRAIETRENANKAAVRDRAEVERLRELLRRCYRVVGSDELARAIEEAVPDV